MRTFARHLEEGRSTTHLEWHTELNPKLWDDGKLKPEVRSVLLRFADTWTKFSGVPQDSVQDVILTGGNANFNYTSASDVDVHIVVDRSRLGKNREFVDDYLQDKKRLWTLTHNIRVLGYPVEPYVQDVSEGYHSGQGVFSLKRDEWIQKPQPGQYDFEHDKDLKRKVHEYAHLINAMITSKAEPEAFDKLKKKIADMRGAGIQKAGEFAPENSLFKALRNRGLLDAMNKYLRSAKDEQLTLK